MGHPGNWSERKLRQVEAVERAKRTFGWWRAGAADPWAPVDSAAGLKARRARLCARCSAGDCSRRIRLNPDFWIARGLGDSQMSIIKTAYFCARTPCGLIWEAETYPGGVPLICYADTAGAEVVVTCRACKHRKTLTARRFVDWLIGRNCSPNVAGWDLNGTVRGRCPTCGERQWSVGLRVPGQIIRAPPGLDGAA